MTLHPKIDDIEPSWLLYRRIPFIATFVRLIMTSLGLLLALPCVL